MKRGSSQARHCPGPHTSSCVRHSAAHPWGAPSRPRSRRAPRAGGAAGSTGAVSARCRRGLPCPGATAAVPELEAAERRSGSARPTAPFFVPPPPFFFFKGDFVFLFSFSLSEKDRNSRSAVPAFPKVSETTKNEQGQDEGGPRREVTGRRHKESRPCPPPLRPSSRRRCPHARTRPRAGPHSPGAAADRCAPAPPWPRGAAHQRGLSGYLLLTQHRRRALAWPAPAAPRRRRRPGPPGAGLRRHAGARPAGGLPANGPGARPPRVAMATGRPPRLPPA